MNPIIQALNLKRQLNKSMDMLNGIKNPDVMFNQMMNTNPQFRQFVEANKGKSPEQIAQENGIDLNALRSLLR